MEPLALQRAARGTCPRAFNRAYRSRNPAHEGRAKLERLTRGGERCPGEAVVLRSHVCREDALLRS